MNHRIPSIAIKITLLYLSIAYGLSSATLAYSSNDKLVFSKSEIWQKLLHYKNGKSEIISDGFFLARNGDRNPLSELNATITAFNSAQSNSPDDQAICKFPARRVVIERALGYQFPKIKCPKLEVWKDKLAPTSISLLFATGYLENPASYYGHILVKFNKQVNLGQVDLLDNSLNFGALNTQNDGILKYVFKGLLGGYDSAFSDQLFYRHNLSYGESQLRDIWEYELNLKPEEIDIVISHTWELLPHKFTYYFLKQNCAYRMAELIELVSGRQLISKIYPFAIPYSVFDSIAEHGNNTESELVTAIHYLPSRQRKLSLKFKQLDKSEQYVAKTLIRTDFDIVRSGYDIFDNKEKARVLEVLLDYYQFLSAKEENPNHKLSVKNRIARERFKLPASLVKWDLDEGTPPHLGSKPSMIRFAIKRNAYADEIPIFRYRAAYYDFLSPDHARLPNSKLVALELGLEVLDGDLKIEKFDLLDIHTLNTSLSGLPGDGGLAWQFNVGYKDLLVGCDDCRTSQAKFGVGISKQIGPITPYIMSNVRVHGDVLEVGEKSTQIEAGLLVGINNFFKLQFVAVNSHYFRDNIEHKNKYIISSRFFDKKSWDVRVKLAKEVSLQSELTYSYYF